MLTLFEEDGKRLNNNNSNNNLSAWKINKHRTSLSFDQVGLLTYIQKWAKENELFTKQRIERISIGCTLPCLLININSINSCEKERKREDERLFQNRDETGHVIWALVRECIRHEIIIMVIIIILTLDYDGHCRGALFRLALLNDHLPRIQIAQSQHLASNIFTTWALSAKIAFSFSFSLSPRKHFAISHLSMFFPPCEMRRLLCRTSKVDTTTSSSSTVGGEAQRTW